MPQADFGFHTNWLSVFTVDAARFGATRDQIIAALTEDNIESRPVWKPMHMQPVFAKHELVAHGPRAVSAESFANGVCLPSSSSLTQEEQTRVIDVVRAVARASQKKAG